MFSFLGSSSAERMRVAQAGTAMIDRLAVLEGEPPGVGLRRVRVGLHHPGPFPEPVRGELLGGELGAGEVRDSALGAREARHALAVHRRQTARRTWSLDASGETYFGRDTSGLQNDRTMADAADSCGAAEPDLAEAAAQAPADARRSRARCARCCRRSSRSGGSTTGAARSGSRALFDRTLVEFFYRYWFRCRGRGHRERARRRRRAAGLQPRRRAASGRGDDRQGDPRGAPAAAAAVHDRRALLQGLSRASRC